MISPFRRAITAGAILGAGLAGGFYIHGQQGTQPSTTTTVTPGSANVFLSANGDDNGTNCGRFSPARTNPDPSGVTDCLTPDTAYKKANQGDTVEVNCSAGNYQNDDFPVNYDSTKASATQYVTFQPATNCPTNSVLTPTGTISQAQYEFGCHTTASAQFNNAVQPTVNTIPVASTAGCVTPGKVYIGWDTYDNCTGQTPTSFTGCVESIVDRGIVWNAGTDIKQGSLQFLGAKYIKMVGLKADYNIQTGHDQSNLSCGSLTGNTVHTSNHIWIDRSTLGNYKLNAEDQTITNTEIGPDNAITNAKVQPLCNGTGGIRQPTGATLIQNVEYKSMTDNGCNISQTNITFPPVSPHTGNDFCHAECLYISDTTGLTLDTNWFNGCPIQDLFTSDDANLGVNYTVKNSIFETPTSPGICFNNHSDTAGVTTTVNVINSDFNSCSNLFQSNSGNGHVNLTWANNIGGNPATSSSVYGTFTCTNNVTFSASGCTNNLTSAATTEWTNPGVDYDLHTGAAAIDHASGTYAPTTDAFGVARCGSAPDDGPFEFCPSVPVTGASLASCTANPCTAGSPISPTRPSSCSGTATPVGSGVPAGGTVFLGNMSDGVQTDCRYYMVYKPAGLTGSAPVIVFGHGNQGCFDNASDITTAGLDTLANANKAIVVMLMLEFTASTNACTPPPTGTGDRPSGNWFHWNRDYPDPVKTVPQDYTYVQAVVADIKARMTGSLTVDPARIWYIGGSSGGGLGEGIACDDATSSLFRGVTVQSLWDVQGTTTNPSTATPVPLSERCGGGTNPVSTNKNFFFQFLYAMNAPSAPNGNCLAAGAPGNGHCSASYADISQFMSNRWNCTGSVHLVTGANNNFSDTYVCPTGGYRGVIVPGSGDGYPTIVAKGYTMQQVFDYFNNASWTGP